MLRHMKENVTVFELFYNNVNTIDTTSDLSPILGAVKVEFLVESRHKTVERMSNEDEFEIFLSGAT